MFPAWPVRNRGRRRPDIALFPTGMIGAPARSKGPGAGLYSAGRGFAPPGSTKPADAVFALRETIPVACARSGSLRATLAGAGFETAPVSRTWLGRFAPFTRPLSDPTARASRRGASHRRRSFPCPRLPVKGLRLVSGSAFTRRRRTLDVLPHPHPDRVPKTARASSNRASPSPARRSAPAFSRSSSSPHLPACLTLSLRFAPPLSARQAPSASLDGAPSS